MSDPEVVLVFPPLNVLVTHPELGIPQLSAHLRARAVETRQWDLNMEFLYRYLTRSDVLRRILGGASRAWDAESLGKAVNLAKPAASRLRLRSGFARYAKVRAAKTNVISFIKEVRIPPLDRPGVWRVFVETLEAVYVQPASRSAAGISRAASAGLPLLDAFFSEFLGRIPKSGAPRILGITICSFAQLVPAMILARMARARFPKIRVLAGGTWCTAAKELLPGFSYFFKCFDAAVIHEGETPLFAALERVRAGKDLSGLPGVVLPGQPVPDPAPPVPLEKLALPEYDGFPMELYPMKTAAVRLTRGCHWARCTFCHHVYPGYTELVSTAPDEISAAHLGRMLGHMRDLRERFGITHFTTADNGPSPRVLQAFSKRLIKENESFTWDSLARFEAGLDKGHYRLLAKAGCKELFFGLETSSAKELGAFSKGIDMRTAQSCLKGCAKAGITAFAFVLCHPFQRLDSFRGTLAWAAERADFLSQVILFRFCLARFSRAYSRAAELGMELLPASSRCLDVFDVPFKVEGELPVEAFIREGERFEEQCRGKDGLPRPRISWGGHAAMMQDFGATGLGNTLKGRAKKLR